MSEGMFYTYEPPAYAFEDDAEDYTHCDGQIEVMILRFLKIYCDLAGQRYTKYLDLKRINMTPGPTDFRESRDYCRRITKAVAMLDKAGESDPAWFVAFVFEDWQNKGGHDTYLHADISIRGKKIDPSAKAGFAYPSMMYIATNYQELVEVYLDHKAHGWRPTKYIVRSEIGDFSPGKYLDKKINRWLDLESADQEVDLIDIDYWAKLSNWHRLNHPSAKAIRQSQSFLCCATEFARMYEFEATTAHGIRDELADRVEEWDTKVDERAAEIYAGHRAARERGEEPQYVHLQWIDPNFEFCSEVDRDRILAFHQAQLAGEDVMDDAVQRRIEERVNPIDHEHTDTISYFMYGDTLPVRLDGSVVTKEELEEMKRAKRKRIT